EHALTIRALLIEKYPQHLEQAFRDQVDADLLVAGLGKGSAELWPRLEPIVKTCLESDDENIVRKLVNAYGKANADMARKVVVLLAPRWKDIATAKSTLPEKMAALRKFLNMDDNKTSSVAAFRLLLNPIGDADEEVSLDVFKALLGESTTLTAE